jgi:hypothetical protein
MKRSDFLKSIIGGAVVAAISPMLLAKESVAAIPVEVNALKPYCYSFKITEECYRQLVKQPIVGITNPLHPLDALCRDLTGYPIKEIGFCDDDFAKNYYTVVSFRAEIEREKYETSTPINFKLTNV